VHRDPKGQSPVPIASPLPIRHSRSSVRPDEPYRNAMGRKNYAHDLGRDDSTTGGEVCREATSLAATEYHSAGEPAKSFIGQPINKDASRAVKHDGCLNSSAQSPPARRSEKWLQNRDVVGFVVSISIGIHFTLPMNSVHCVAMANRARISCCAARFSNVASLTSNITLIISPVKANGDSYSSETGEQVSQPMSKPSLAVK
jgi:hypothetical protein